MNDSEIIKALTTSSDPNNLNCQPTTKLCKNALDLINRQQAEIDTMKDTMAKLLNTLERANKYGLGADERIEQLKIELEKAKSEAVREFAERLKAEDFDRCIDVIYDGSGEVKRTEIRRVLFNKQIDNLVKETGCNDG